MPHMTVKRILIAALIALGLAAGAGAGAGTAHASAGPAASVFYHT